MNISATKHHRIHMACQELEHALNNFEDETEAQQRKKEEQDKIDEIKKRLAEIKAQLDEL